MCLRSTALILVAAFGSAANSGCRSQPLVEQADGLRLHFATGPTTTLYRAAADRTTAAGRAEYEQVRFEGDARFTYRGEGDWSGEIADWTEPGQAISQPLGWGRSQATLAPAAAGAEGAEGAAGDMVLTLAGGTGAGAPIELVLESVSGTWADFTAGRDLVLKLGPDAFDRWVQSTGAAMQRLIEQRRAILQARLPRGHWLGGIEIGDMVIAEQPLVRANQEHLMIFFEPMEIEATFYILHLRRGRRR